MKARAWLPFLLLGLALLLPHRAPAQDAGAPAPAGLLGVRWTWVHFTAKGAAELAPAHPEAYWVEFLPDGALAISADCNRATGTWTSKGTQLTLKALASTLAACPEGSLDSRFLQLLAAVGRGSVRGRTLLLWLPGDAGVLHLAATPQASPPRP